MNGHMVEDGEVSKADAGPSLGGDKLEIESVSDSSDWNHEGNGMVCMRYVHDGCKHGNDCKYSHGPGRKERA